VDQTRIIGLAAFQRDLRAMGAEWPRELRGINLDAAQVVTEQAQARARALGGVHQHVAASIKAAAEQRRAKVVLDSNKEPALLGAEFGSHQFRQFPGWRGNRWTDPEGLEVGYMVHPTIRELVRSDRLVDLYGDRLEDLAKRAFPD
jgi:hypothetical protein